MLLISIFFKNSHKNLLPASQTRRLVSSLSLLRPLLVMNFQKIIEKRRLALTKQAAETAQAMSNLNSEEVEAKLKKREELLLQVKVIEAELVSILDIPHEELFGTGASPKRRISSASSLDSAGSKRERLKSLPEELKLVKIAELLRADLKGLSAKEISGRIGDTYNTVSAHLAKHTEIYLKSGKKRSTVYSLKQ